MRGATRPSDIPTLDGVGNSLGWRGSSLRRLLAAAVAGGVLLVPSQVPAWSVVTSSGAPAAPDTSQTLYQVRDGDAAYVPPTNGYSDGGVGSYCLLTQDAAKASATQVIAPDGVHYPLTSVFVGTKVSAAQACIGPNKTLFVDAGTYDSDLHYAALSPANFSLVGVATSGGRPAATLVRTYSTGGPTVVDRYLFYQPDVHIENVILDGAGKDMRDNKDYGWYAVVVGTGAVGFVAQDVIIQNVGNSNSIGWFGTNRNSALQVLYEQTGTRHFVNLTVKDIKTTNYGAGVIFTNQTNKTYFYNLVMDGSLAAANTWGPRVEHASLSIMPDLTRNSAVFAGPNTSIKASNGADFIQVQDYRYDLIGVPAAYRYVEYSTHNGNTNTGAYRVYKTPPAATASTAILDRTDGYWLVRESEAVGATAQIDAIRAVRTHLLGLASPALPASRVPAANIKIAPPAAGALVSFSVADFGTGTPVTLVAVPDAAAPATGSTLVPVAADFTASLGTTANAANVALYNVDFASRASLTLTEVLSGIAAGSIAPTDPRDGSYPPGLNYADYATPKPAAVTAGATIAVDALRNCRFVTLAVGEPATVQALHFDLSATALYVAGTGQATATAPAWYTAATPPASGSSTGADDPSVAYFSADPTIATVDKTTGVITGVGPGTVTIYAKALDSQNQGEVEKPYAAGTITVRAWLPGLTLTKEVQPLGHPPVLGDSVTYAFTVTNSGNVPLTQVGVTDATLGTVTCAATALAPLESTTCSAAAHVIAQADVDAGRVLNQAKATAVTTVANPTSDKPDQLSAEASATLDIPQHPAIDLVKSVTAPPRVTAGDSLTYAFTVTNTGDVTLTGVGVTDPLVGQVSCPETTLAPGQSTTCSAAPYVVTPADANAQQVVNTATAVGTPPVTQAAESPAPVSDTDSVTVPVQRDAAPVVDVLPTTGGSADAGFLGLSALATVAGALVVAVGLRRRTPSSD